MLARLKPHTIVGMFVVLDGHGGRECAELVFKRLGYHVLVRAPHLRQHICLSFELTPIDSIALCNPTFAYAPFLPNIQFRTPGRTTQLFVGSWHCRKKQRADDGVRFKLRRHELMTGMTMLSCTVYMSLQGISAR